MALESVFVCTIKPARLSQHWGQSANFGFSILAFVLTSRLQRYRFRLETSKLVVSTRFKVMAERAVLKR